MSFFSHISPIPSFPEYGGPHRVGTCDVEIPTLSLESPVACPNDTIGTVAFRMFYPCEAGSSGRPVRWLPSPQSKYGAAYCRFSGAGPWLSDVLALLPQFLYMTKLPAVRNASLLPPVAKSGRWPVMIFSHGLGGSRNAYSHICGSLASYGIVVVAPDHRDGSAPISFIRPTKNTSAQTIDYVKLPHTPTPEVYQARDEQLRIRLWELGCIHEAVIRTDLGQGPENLDPNKGSQGETMEILSCFKEKLDVHRPGSIIWAGHSFGAATAVQLLKSTYYNSHTTDKHGQAVETLFAPDQSCSLVKQITSSSVTLLLDIWCLPLRSPMTQWLWNKPLPCYDTSKAEVAPAGGKAILVVLSEAFFKWTVNLNDTKFALSSRAEETHKHIAWTPYAFYPTSSAHLSQSDFGILFPWLLARFLKAKEPARILRLNARAILQTLRVNGFEIAPPMVVDLEDDNRKLEKKPQDAIGQAAADDNNDSPILASNTEVRGWNHIQVQVFEVQGAEGDSARHVEQDYQNDHSEPDEARVLNSKTPDA